MQYEYENTLEGERMATRKWRRHTIIKCIKPRKVCKYTLQPDTMLWPTFIRPFLSCNIVRLHAASTLPRQESWVTYAIKPTNHRKHVIETARWRTKEIATTMRKKYQWRKIIHSVFCKRSISFINSLGMTPRHMQIYPSNGLEPFINIPLLLFHVIWAPFLLTAFVCLFVFFFCWFLFIHSQNTPNNMPLLARAYRVGCEGVVEHLQVHVKFACSYML